MKYFVTGASGFIGRRLVEKLLQHQENTVYYLILERELSIMETLRERWGQNADRTVPIIGDLAQPRLGVADGDLARLTGQIDHLFHLAAIYDLKASAEIQEKVNIQGTRHVVAFAADKPHRGLPRDQREVSGLIGHGVTFRREAGRDPSRLRLAPDRRG